MTEQPNRKTSWKKLPESVRRESILKGAQACFASKGFPGTSVNDIAAAAGLTKGGVYFHFGSKDEIREALIADFTRSVESAVDEILASDRGKGEQLRAVLTLLLDRMGAEDGLLLTITESVTRHGAGIPEIRSYYQQLSSRVGEVIRLGRDDGAFLNDSEIELLVELLLATISGLALHREMDRAGINLCELKNEVVDYLVRIVRAPVGGG